MSARRPLETLSATARNDGAETARTCQRCELPAEGAEDRCRECGSFLPGNVSALIHGGRRFVDGRSPMDQAQAAEIRRAVVEDLGGEGACSEVMLRLVDDFAFAVTLRDLLAQHLAAVGPLTRRNQKRAALDAWHRASARAEALAAKVGLERRAAPVPSLSEYLEQRQREAEQAASATETAADASDDERVEADPGAEQPVEVASAENRGAERHADARSPRDGHKGIPGSDAASTASLADDEGIPRAGEQARS
jgi:hypothetical protein